MSRSVTIDYDKLREREFKLIKTTASIKVSDEQLFVLMGYTDKRYERKATKIINMPTQETWAQYYAAVGALRVLKEYEFTEWGGPDYGTEVLEPTPTNTYEYLETYTEWLARCRALRQETA